MLQIKSISIYWYLGRKNDKKVNLKCASYKELATLETDKKINLIYGLNGSGKSTFSEYLRIIECDDEKFANCSIETDNA